jgi:hypothetical protein
MAADSMTARRRWAVAVGASLGLTALVLLLFRAPRPVAPAPPAPKLTLGLGQSAAGSTDVLLSQEAFLHDPTPLFLPTRWNSTPAVPQPEPGDAFHPFPAELVFATDQLKLNLPPPVTVPASPPEALVTRAPGNPLLGIGRTDASVPVLPSRGAFIEIAAAGTGAPVFSRALADARPPTSAPWQPLEFLVEVDAAGLVGPPVLTARSGVERVDAYFGGSGGYLAQDLRVGELLNPGFYRIFVGP